MAVKHLDQWAGLGSLTGVALVLQGAIPFDVKFVAFGQVHFCAVNLD
ncbi:hypothetical protein FOQG_00811 [Fusarium oxysporum f. sp. raphani 54005]|jgi:hypothetical protein|uniref:Uncharacterized protein n=6 Tax=Fusarium oxysporum TaxID=5507 RepID=W9IUL1_FUSOX|nr:hypothetical protein FOXG_18224 [Fusarium oxysporum f. sp. lycopersici 4287]EWY98377.1 hypothetical protein FOYG_02899 [Fusarium oxysporum NRRL 32931]EXA49738.1 hypothetical protein FOVG_02767 [Fusarium oxysporum f. sp. pisi HDV247]EXK41816.1 hypothetical protein FOMG_05065 [Fusarium oxysporum f. sp. melonis 26406]EXL00832.1 hypothetical protein FOQG_00811 [Fusarium oxysporum f. sp. raphani 54005]EXL73674.1 hypothetical protein FOPG_11023 [Fusarium oxysporum f. sp. conglutinans race 2 54008